MSSELRPNVQRPFGVAMIWENSTIVKLIKMYESYPELWDHMHEEFKNRPRKREILNQIAIQFNTSIYEVNRKLNSLMTQYRRERNIFKKSQESGAEETKMPWWAYKHFEFLNNRGRFDQKTFSNAEVCR